nr:hypothetical protein [Mycolicibacterium sp. TUM20984]
MDVVRRIYGASVIHLIVVLASFALAAYTISVLGLESLFNPKVWWQSIAVWFAVAIIAHDLILFPLYALADRLLPKARQPSTGHRGDHAPPSGRLPVTNYVRMPTLASGLLLLLFFPGIIEQGADTFNQATGLTQAPYLTRWLVITAILYLISALFYGAKVILQQRDAADEDGAGAQIGTG